MAGLYLTLRGTPILYYGEELGMENNDPTRKEDVKDPLGRSGWPTNKGRDGERTPMQWNGEANAGFSPSTPWLPVTADYKTHNVESETEDPNSILRFYQQLLGLRHRNRALLDGDYIALNQADPNVLAYLRRYKDETVLVVLNMSGGEQSVRLDLAQQGLPEPRAKTLLTTLRASPENLGTAPVALEPYAVYIAQLQN
jgi:alpha-glucosidase